MKYLRVAASVTALLLILVLTSLASTVKAAEAHLFTTNKGSAYVIEWEVDHTTIGRDVIALIEYRMNTGDKFRVQWEIAGCITGDKVVTTVFESGIRQRNYWSANGRTNLDVNSNYFCILYREGVEKRRQNLNPTRSQPMT